jgi:hypothetical protein
LTVDDRRLAQNAVLRACLLVAHFSQPSESDSRVDDASAGWKGKGVWTTWGTRTRFHSETGKGTTSKVVHFQIRSDPLAD